MSCLCKCGLPANRYYRQGHDAIHMSVVLIEMHTAQSRGLPVDQALKALPTPKMQARALRTFRGHTGQATKPTSELFPARVSKDGRLEINSKYDGSGQWIPGQVFDQDDRERLVNASEVYTFGQGMVTRVGRWIYPVRDSNGVTERNTKTDGSGEWVTGPVQAS